MHVVQYLQGFSGICWAVVAIRMAPATWRALFGATRRLDPLLSVCFYMGVLQSGFVLRWIFYHAAISEMRPAELSLWTALYALCGLLALWVLKVGGAYDGKSQ